MAATRTSSRQAARKASEAISSTGEKASTGTKRKEAGVTGTASKRGKKTNQQPQPKVKEEDRAGEPVEDVKAEQPSTKHEHTPVDGGESKPAVDGVEAGVRRSQDREDIMPSSVLEKGIIYFFYRPRVNVPEAHSVDEVARSFIVLRPTPRGGYLDQGQGPLEAGAKCRLLMLPKKKFPTSGRERDMGFVEKSGQSMKALQDSFITGGSYETSTRGERTLEPAKPYAEGVYAITAERRATHLVYILTIPEKAGDIQKDLGLRDRGSWIVQSKNPKFPGPSYAKLPKEPEYPEHIREKLGNLRWVPMEPDLIDYPNAQFLMVGSAQDDLGKAATALSDAKTPEQEQPGEELQQLELENEHRIEALKGDHTVYEDLGLEAKNYPKVPTTWSDQS